MDRVLEKVRSVMFEKIIQLERHFDLITVHFDTTCVSEMIIADQESYLDLKKKNKLIWKVELSFRHNYFTNSDTQHLFTRIKIGSFFFIWFKRIRGIKIHLKI